MQKKGGDETTVLNLHQHTNITSEFFLNERMQREITASSHMRKRNDRRTKRRLNKGLDVNQNGKKQMGSEKVEEYDQRHKWQRRATFQVHLRVFRKNMSAEKA